MEGQEVVSDREADDFVRRYAAGRFGAFRCASLMIDLGDGLPHDIRVVLPEVEPTAVVGPAPDRPSSKGASSRA